MLWLFVMLPMVFSLSLSIPSSVYLHPGECVNLSVTLLNNEPITYRDVSLIFPSNPSLTYPSLVDIGRLDTGASAHLSLPVCAQSHTPEGAYFVRVKLKGKKDLTNLEDVEHAVSGFTVFVENTRHLSLTFTETGRCKGNLHLSTNHPIYDVEIISSLPLSNGSLFIPLINNSTSIPISFQCTGVLSQTTSTMFTVRYRSTFNHYSATFPITFKTHIPPITVQLSSNDTLLFNKQKSITLYIKNLGETLTDVKLFPIQGVELVGKNFIFFPVLSPNTTSVSATLRADYVGTRNTMWVLTAVSNGRQVSLNLTIPFTAHDDVKPDVFVEIERKQSEQYLTVIVSNPYTTTMRNVEIALQSPCLSDARSFGRQYIGEIDGGDFGTAQFKVAYSSTCNVTVVAHYVDNNNVFHTIKRTVTLKPAYTPKQQSTTNITFVIIAFILGLAVMFVLKR